MKFLTLILLAIIAWLISRLIYTVNSYREDLGDIKQQLKNLNAKLPQQQPTANTTETAPVASSESAPVTSAQTAPASPPLKAPETVNINKASKTRLQTLPKIGAVTAQRIIDARPYAAIEDLMQVEGITPELFAQIKTRLEL